MASPTAELKNAQTATALATAELVNLLADSELPLAEVTAKISKEMLARAWASGDIEFGVTTHVFTGAPHAEKPNVPQVKGKTLVIEQGIDWTGPKTKNHGPAKAIIAAAVMPEAKFYQHYRQEVRVSKDPEVWEFLKAGDSAENHEPDTLRWVRVDCNRQQAEKMFGWWVKLTDKGLSQLQTA